MNIIIWFISGIILGIIIGFFIKRPKEEGVSKEQGMITELMEEKQKNLEKMRAYLKDKQTIANDEIQKVLGVSDATIVRYLNELEKEGLIRQKGATGQSVYYEVLK